MRQGLFIKRFCLKLLSTCFFIFFSSCNRAICPDNGCVEAEIEKRIQKQVEWVLEDSAKEQINCFVQALLSAELNVDTAVQIALLNNPRIQAVFENIGIAKADLIEAGLLSNPFIDGFFRFPNQKHLKLNTEISVLQNFIDVLLIPLRTKVAAAELQQVIFETTHTILEIAFDVERTYFELVFLQKQKELLQDVMELAKATNHISQAQLSVQNINSFEWQYRTANYLARIAELAEVEANVIHFRQMLSKQMGLSSPCMCWFISSELPKLPSVEPSLECLEQIARKERLDLQAAILKVEKLKRSFPTLQWWTFTEFQAGVSSERDEEGPSMTGPLFAGRLPIFNFGQAARCRLMAELRQAQAQLAALEIEVDAEVSEAKDVLLVFRNQVELYETHLLPNQVDILTSAEELYNVMGMGVFALLDHKQTQLQTLLKYYAALKNYWMAKVDLEEAIGGNLRGIE